MMLQKMIKEGTSIREPGVRRKPVMAALPKGITMDDIQGEMRRLLEADNVVNVAQEAGEKIWAEKIETWMAKHLYKP